jgi:hypothetical protein
MIIHGLTVSVNYADLLSKGIAAWRAGLDSLTVVTDPLDGETVDLAERHHATVRVTDLFYRDGAVFNKGRAQEWARQSMPWMDWILFFDADIIPLDDWKDQLERLNLQPGWLYGCDRYDSRGFRLPDDSHAYGYFQLFHSEDPLAQDTPLIDTHWTHAGNSDSFLMLRWRHAGRLAPPLPLRLIHQGNGPSHNWYGRGNADAFRRMELERRRKGGGWSSLSGERIF